MHPLSNVHLGAPRANMVHFYFGGYHYIGLFGSPIRVIFRPAAIDKTGKILDLHSSLRLKR